MVFDKMKKAIKEYQHVDGFMIIDLKRPDRGRKRSAFEVGIERH